MDYINGFIACLTRIKLNYTVVETYHGIDIDSIVQICANCCDKRTYLCGYV